MKRKDIPFVAVAVACFLLIVFMLVHGSMFARERRQKVQDAEAKASQQFELINARLGRETSVYISDVDDFLVLASESGVDRLFCNRGEFFGVKYLRLWFIKDGVAYIYKIGA